MEPSQNTQQDEAPTDGPQEQIAFAVVQGQPFTQIPQDLYIPPDALEVILEAFEGPLDLLLYLIRRQNLDILDIPVAEITRQYIEYVEMLQDVQFELAAEYLVMAAILAEIKTKVVQATDQVSAQDYFSAAVFYHETKRELPTAAGWMDNAIAMQPGAFWMVQARAELAYDMGDMERAKQDALRARQIAGDNPDGDYGYIAKANMLLGKIDA